MACTINSSTRINSNLNAFERVHNYPIVNDSFELALSYYQWAKSKNIILDVTLNKLEGALKTVKDKTEPMVADRFNYLDTTVCNQLEKFEKLCPIILQPSETIRSIPGHIYHDRIEPSIQRVVKPVTTTFNVVSRTSCAAAYMMSSTIPGSALARGATLTVLDKTEQLLDRLLPKQYEETDNTCQNSNGNDIGKKIKRLSTKTRQRIFKKISRDINNFRKLSLEKLEQIYSIIVEIKNSKTTVCKENIRYNKLISDGVQYSDHLQTLITSAAKSLPKILCFNTMSLLDLLNQKLFLVRNTIQDSTNRNLISEKRINQAADTIDFARSWIEYVTDNLKEFYSKCDSKESDDFIFDEDDEESPESSSTDDISEEEPSSNHL